MSRSELLEELKRLSNADRLTVIESATRMIREQLQEPATHLADADAPILQVAGCLSGSCLSAEDIESDPQSACSRPSSECMARRHRGGPDSHRASPPTRPPIRPRMEVNAETLP